MAAVSTWNDIEDGQLLSVIETNINAFNTSVETQVNSNTTNIATLQGTVGTNTEDIANNTAAIGTNTEDIATNTEDIASISDRITNIEAGHSVLLNATSTSASQQPTALDTSLQIEFGAAQTTTDIDISNTGALTFKTAGKYIISFFFQYGRIGGVGTSNLLNRLLINGVQVGNTLGAKIDNADVLVPWSSTVQITLEANDVLTTEIVRDSSGNNSGGIFALTPIVAGWNNAPCASVQVYKVV